jgi:nickel-dependent lactate racemase
MPELSVPWGHDQLELKLPDDWQVEQVASRSVQRAPEDWPERLARALSQPAVGLPLGRLLAARPHGKVAIVVEDVTRHSPTPRILEVIMREIRHARIPDEQVEVVFATGMHPAMSPAQAAEKLGPAMEGIRRRSNPWADGGAYVHLGQIGRAPVRIDRSIAAADIRILVSSVSPHLQGGFGGGYKMFFPGCAPLDTIRALHRLGIGRRPRQLVGLSASRNPMRRVIDSAGRMVDDAGGKTFSVQYLLDDQDLPQAIAAGEVLPIHRMLRKRCSVDCGIVASGQADVLITNAHPRDFDLWQCFKSIPNTMWAARPNGVIICLARCEAGLYGMKVPPWPLGPTWTRRLVRLIGPEAISSLLTRLMPSMAGDAAFFIRLAAQTLCRNHIIMVSPALHAAGATFPGLRIVASMDEAIAAAERRLPEGSRRVVVFPFGGVTFPIPAPPNGRNASAGGGAGV